MIRHSYGYSLRHRGFTRNGGTEFDGYSRLDDGNPESYWKSNPYLTRDFTGEDDSHHPQWVVIALDKKESVNAIRIQWADPFARDFQVQYWEGDGDAMDEQDKGAWRNFPSGRVTDGKGGDSTLPLSASPVTTKFIRIWMTRSANTCDTHGSTDRRNCVGYAIRELYAGTMAAGGELKDILHHSPDQKQTLTLCSSVDLWHDPSDLYVAPDRMELGDQQRCAPSFLASRLPICGPSYGWPGRVILNGSMISSSSKLETEGGAPSILPAVSQMSSE